MAGEKSRVRRLPRRNARDVTFSKRRASLLKDASELCTLCAAEAAIILFLPGGKAFCYGHPSVDAVINRFQNAGCSSTQPAETDQDSDCNPTSCKLCKQYLDLIEEIKVEEKKAQELEKKMEELQRTSWMAAPIDSLNLEQLVLLKGALLDLKEAVNKRNVELSIPTAADKASDCAFPLQAKGMELDVQNQ